jgi:esterase
MTATERFTKLGGLRARYLTWGDPAQPAVLMLHGLRSYGGTWTPFARELAASHHIVAPDFRGRGGSEWDPARDYYIRTYVADLEELVVQLGLAEFTIVGHSMGGAVGYVYAAAHPEQVTGLLAEDIGPGSSTSTPGAERVMREMASAPLSFDSLDAAAGYWRQIRPGITRAALASRMDHTLEQGPDGRWHWTLDMAGIAVARLSGDPAGQIDLWACVDALRCPALVLRGEHTDFLPVATCEQMAARQPLVEWAEVPGAGHYAHDDNPGFFMTALREFLIHLQR